jgi:hypothetical protein
LEDASEAALEEMMAMMGELQTNGLKVKICQDLLDRDVRASRTKRLQADGTVHHDFISPAVLLHAAATAKELERFAGPKLTEDNGDNSGHSSDS